MRSAVQGNDARVMILFSEQDYVIRRLKHLNIVVVASGADRGASFCVLDTPIPCIEILPGLGRTFSSAHGRDALSLC
jgi:hypothetical protein